MVLTLIFPGILLGIVDQFPKGLPGRACLYGQGQRKIDVKSEVIKIFEGVIVDIVRVHDPGSDQGGRARIADGVTVVLAFCRCIRPQGVGCSGFVYHHNLRPKDLSQLFNEYPCVDIPATPRRNGDNELNRAIGIGLCLGGRSSHTHAPYDHQQTDDYKNPFHFCLLCKWDDISLVKSIEWKPAILRVSVSPLQFIPSYPSSFWYAFPGAGEIIDPIEI